MVGVDGGTEVYGTPLNLFDRASSWPILRSPDLFVAFGSEKHGLSDDFLDACDHLVTLPCLSASINVSSCFAAVDAVLKVMRMEMEL